ncbi:MAG: glycoside hydrolase family 15 protein [Bacteroidota bacterium]
MCECAELGIQGGGAGFGEDRVARAFVAGNGTVLAAGDRYGSLQEIYIPHLAPEHQALARPARIGLHADGAFHWLEDAFDATVARSESAPIADLSLRGRDLPFEIWIETFADARLPILARRVEVRNRLGGRHDLRLVFHYDFRTGFPGAVTSRDAATGGVVHHGGRRALSVNAIGPDGIGVPQVTIAGERGASGFLLGIPIPLAPSGSAMVTTWLAAAGSVPDARRLDAEIRRVGIPGLLGRTRGYWSLWASAGSRDEGDLPEEVLALYAQGLLTLRLLQAPSGAILSTLEAPAAEGGPEGRWCALREAALAADALGRAGYGSAARRYFEFTARAAREAGELTAILDADGAPAPAPEHALRAMDGLAVHVWAAARHLERERDVELMAPIYQDAIAPTAERLAAAADPSLGLPVGPDLWDERWGAHASVAAAVRGGLKAASRMAALFGETARARSWLAASDTIGRAVVRTFYDPERGRFLRALSMEEGERRLDPTLDASLLWLGLFDDLEPEDPRVKATAAAVRAGLWIPGLGGLARHEADAGDAGTEREGSGGRASLKPTLWLAQHTIRAARHAQDLEAARILLLWTAARAEGSGLLPERLLPGAAPGEGTCPSLGATAAFVTTVLDYGERARLLARCDRCGQPAPVRRARGATARAARSLPGLVADL